jgi:hypothetical protein
MLDAGYWILDAGYWMLDTGYWILITDNCLPGVALAKTGSLITGN